MKKLIAAILILGCLSVNAQSGSQLAPISKGRPITNTVQVIQLTMDTTAFKQLIAVIDQNVDSKSQSKMLIDFLYKSAKLIDIDKPKEMVKP